MALDSSFRRGDAADAQQNGDDTDEFVRARLPALRSSGHGISVTLWDEIAPSLPRTAPPLADDSPES